MHNIPQHAPKKNWSELNEPREFQEQFPAWLPPFVDVRLQKLDKTSSTHQDSFSKQKDHKRKNRKDKSSPNKRR